MHPSASPNSGPLPPVCAKVNSKTGSLRINSSKARQAAQEFCYFLASEHTVLDSEHTAVGPWIIHGAAEHGGDLALSAIYNTEACSVWKEIELSKAGEIECYRNFFKYISRMCTSLAFLFPIILERVETFAYRKATWPCTREPTGTIQVMGDRSPSSADWLTTPVHPRA